MVIQDVVQMRIMRIMEISMACILLSGCVHRPPMLEAERGLPADRFHHLVSACHLWLYSLDSTPADTRDTQEQSESQLDAWLRPSRYRFQRFPSHWSEQDISEMRNWQHFELLPTLRSIKDNTRLPKEFRHEIQKAIEELEKKLHNKILEPSPKG